MQRIMFWLAGLALVAALSTAAPAATAAKDLHHATQAVAADIKTQRRAQGLKDSDRPRQALGSSKTVRFKLPMKAGQGKDQASAYCFGYTLKCTARVVGPSNTYSGRVSTSEGSQVKFQEHRAGQPLDLTLRTSFFGDTTFTVDMEAGDEPWPSEAEVELVCWY